MQKLAGIRHFAVRDVIAQISDEIAEWRQIEDRNKSWGLDLSVKDRGILNGLIARREGLRLLDPAQMIPDA